MARFLADENFPLPVVEELRRLGHDVLTVYEAGKANQRCPDKEILDFAHTEGRVVVTLNRKHFIRLHEISLDHEGIVVCTVDIDYVGQANRIHQAIDSCSAPRGNLFRVNRPA